MNKNPKDKENNTAASSNRESRLPGTSEQVFDNEINEFNPEESIYELEPFVLPGESITQELAPIVVDQLLTESQSANKSERLVESSQNKASDDQTLNQETNSLPEGQDPDLTPQERKMLFEFKTKKLRLKEESKTDTALGMIIGDKYQVTEVIGQGNMAIIYKVRNIDGEIFAAKTCKPGKFDEDILRFEQEIEIHSKLNHENIVNYIETIEPEPGKKFLIMENIKGISLEDVIELHGPVELAENIWNILGPVCDALAHAHSKGVIHRDLKTGNVILSKKENEELKVKIIDFGIAKTQDVQSQKLTKPGHTVGSPLYMSPEQCVLEELTAASDIYALGILAYELITGKPPYCGDSVTEVMTAHCDPSIHPESLTKRAPNVPLVDRLERIIFKALETFPAQRIESAAEFKIAIEDWINETRKL